MASTPVQRPRLGSRANTDLGPLVNPTPAITSNSEAKEGVKDLGQGTQVSVAGRKLSNGACLPGGVVMPASPFLPLPPAPTAEELLAAERAETVKTPTPSNLLRTSSSRKVNGASELKRTGSGVPKGKTSTTGASGMIRSYSLPVATQREFDQQRRAFAEREADELESQSSSWSSGWPGSADFLGAPRRQTRLTRASSGRVCPLAPTRSNNGGLRTPRSPVTPAATPLSPTKRTFSSSSLRVPIFPPTSQLAAQVFDDSDDDDEEAPPEPENDVSEEAREILRRLSLVDEGSEVEDEDTPTSTNLVGVCRQERMGSYFAPRRSDSQDSDLSRGSSTYDERGPNTPMVPNFPNTLGFSPTPPIGMEHSFSSRFKIRAEVTAGVWVGGKGGKQEESDDEGGLDDLIHPTHLAPPPAMAV
ncbi:hypothetical protein BCV69DRAFT_180482 [Microstroma glucosiphilum]|uniref:Uncharacterized protein n=1 Tax=Pseudomicrostroma glucosiphilum TaxID=1684307 RepID=A0A316U6S2_9BASI|nr:hypothetical protein BCV69DRAFT_180482 [Pseudomicrostroma glucosiphilum]PWN20977.1 hypothetical protein BCV69DRAFT_180482 [Pseudomicrostroma glucosiphilum]